MHKLKTNFFVLALILMALMMLVGSVAAVGPTVTPGYSNLTEAAGVRYRGDSSGNEIYLGIPDLGIGGNRVETSYPDVYSNWQDGTYAVTFSFDDVENKIVTTIDDGNGDSKSLEYDFDDLLAPGCPIADWNTMDINVVDRLDPGELAFNNVILDGNSLGDFDDEGWNNWTVSDFDFSQSFELSGDLVVSGGWTGGEKSKLQIIVGCVTPPPSVTPVSEDPLVCDTGRVDIVIDDVENLYGYEFEVEYDHTLVTADGSFEDTWFLDAAPGLSVPGWKAECNSGLCKFSQTRQLPDATELATTDPQVIAWIDFTNPVEAGVFDVVVKNVKLTDKDSFEIPGAVGGSLQVNVCGEAEVSGQISLQGRPQPGSPFPGISGGTAVAFDVVLNGPLGNFSATPNPIDGTYTVSGVKYLLSGSDYTISADHSVYLQASKTLTVNEATETGQDTTLLGGDAADDGKVFIEDISCVADYFGQATLGLDGYVCTGFAVPTSADLNYDDQVNVQDLALVGGNYNLEEDQGW